MITELGIALDISCDNTPRQQVIGEQRRPQAEMEFATLLDGRWMKPVKLPVRVPRHTRLMGGGASGKCSDYLGRGLDIVLPRQSIKSSDERTSKSEVAPAIQQRKSLITI